MSTAKDDIVQLKNTTSNLTNSYNSLDGEIASIKSKDESQDSAISALQTEQTSMDDRITALEGGSSSDIYTKITSEDGSYVYPTITIGDGLEIADSALRVKEITTSYNVQMNTNPFRIGSSVNQIGNVKDSILKKQPFIFAYKKNVSPSGTTVINTTNMQFYSLENGNITVKISTPLRDIYGNDWYNGDLVAYLTTSSTSSTISKMFTIENSVIPVGNDSYEVLWNLVRLLSNQTPNQSSVSKAIKNILCHNKVILLDVPGNTSGFISNANKTCTMITSKVNYDNSNVSFTFADIDSSGVNYAYKTTDSFLNSSYAWV